MTTNKKIEWLLRIGVAGEFIGHGLLGIGGKKDWIGWVSQMTNVSGSTATPLPLLFRISHFLLALFFFF